MRFSTGQSIGRYVIESPLGEGGMGEVYRARDSKLERSVALKVLRNDTDGAGEDWDHAVMRMQREAQAVAALSHPGIVAIYDIGEHEGSPFIAMELVGGQPLRDLIGKDTPASTRLRILMDDIKPENILVRQDGVAKVLDFGIARRASRNVDVTTQTLDINGATLDAALVGMTADGALVGTPAYMAPEQLRGETADARADQFAWGVVAYELFSGRHPFQAEKGAIGLLASILGDTPPPLSGIPDGVASVVMQALEKDPEKRWSSMQEIVAQCEVFATDGDARKVPTGPRPEIVSPSKTGSATPPVRASRRWLVAPVLSGCALLGAVAFGFRERPAPTVAPVVLPSAAPSTTATAVTELPIPASDKPEAVVAFREGLQNIRDARWTAAVTAFGHARQADPGMAAAHLRYSMLLFSYDVNAAREVFLKAQALRASLSERDQGFLHALEPIIQREPTDYDEAAKRFEALTARYPGDAELTFWHARAVFRCGSTTETIKRAIELNERCVKLDPQYADCWQTKANALTVNGQLDAAVSTLDECIKVSENGVDCLLDKIKLDSWLGRCDVVVDSARQLKMKDPQAVHASMHLANGLYFSGQPEPIVRAAFGDAERISREAGRQFESRSVQLQMGLAFGDFAAAIEKANFAARSMTVPNLDTAWLIHFLRLELYLEMGRIADAAAVADEFFIERTLRPGTVKETELDPTVAMHAVRMRAGKLSRSEFEKLRAEWLEKQNSNTQLNRVVAWLSAYAVPAKTEDLAKDAVGNEGDVSRVLLSNTLPNAQLMALYLGHVYMVVGRHAEALPYLEKASRVCTVDHPAIWHTQNTARLGITREATGDKPGACKAYEQVLSRWGKSKQSVTVKDVAKRAKKLGCQGTSSK